MQLLLALRVIWMIFKPLLTPWHPQNQEIGNSETGCSVCVVAATIEFPSKKIDIKFKTVHKYPMGNEFTGTVLGKAGKSSERYKNVVKIKYSSEMHGKSRAAIDFQKEVSEWQKIEDKTVLFAKTDGPYQEAKMEERRSWEQNDVFESVNDSGQCRRTTRWVLSKKEDGKNNARLPETLLLTPQHVALFWHFWHQRLIGSARFWQSAKT